MIYAPPSSHARPAEGEALLLPVCLCPHGSDRCGHGSSPIHPGIVDAAIPTVFIKAEALGLEGIETPAQIEGSAPLMARIEEIRGRCAEKIGLTDNWKLSTQKCPYAPFFAVVSPSKAYHTFDGKDVAAEEIDLVSRLLFMQKMHETHPVTGTVCMSTAARVPGSIVEQVLSRRGRENRKIIIGHPAGVIPVVSELETENGTRSEERRVGKECRL